MQFLYDCAIAAAKMGLRVPALFPVKTRKWLAAQKGLLAQIVSESRGLNRPVWIHCASLGEFEQGRPLIEKIKDEHPDRDVVLTFFSPSGFNVRKNYEKADRVFYLPLDDRSNAIAFVDAINPVLAIFVKYEVWPNYLSALEERKVPSVLISALFQRNTRYFKPWASFLKQALFKFNHIFVQDEVSKSLLAERGYDSCSVAGDTRIDRVWSNTKNAQRLPILESFCRDRKVIVAGSTWPKDELLLKNLLNQKLEIKMVIAPHEIDATHLSEVEALFGDDLIKYSSCGEGIAPENKRVLLIDNIGMLASLYGYGHWAYVGGGFGAGIHNILEAAVFEIPVMFGPNNKGFREAQDLKGIGVGYEVADEMAFIEAIVKTDVLSEREQIRQRAAEYFEKEKGATETIYAFLKSYLQD